MRNLGIRSKLLAVLCVPMVFLVVVSGVLVLQAAGTARLLVASLGVLAVCVPLLAVLVLSRRMVDPLRRLTAAAEDLHERLPAMVEQMRTPGVGPDLVIEPIDVPGEDEIGRLAQAFNAVNKLTVEVAHEQAALRGSIAEMFVNVARRNQTLLGRQLAFLDQLEAREEDPDTLENLFRLDHLAARMRRNAESLLVLAGIDSTRRLRTPMPLSDVVRTAIGEIETYERVDLTVDVDPAVSGRLALSVAHLLAELLDNATSFSDPQTRVLVSTGIGAEGVDVTIYDSGLGMTEEEIEEAHQKLADAPAAESAVAQRLGFYVVGRIAARLGASVRLSSRRAGGLAATVTLSESIFADGALAGLRPATPEVPAPAADEPVNGFAAARADLFAGLDTPAFTPSFEPAEVAPAAPAVDEPVRPAEPAPTAGGLPIRVRPTAPATPAVPVVAPILPAALALPAPVAVAPVAEVPVAVAPVVEAPVTDVPVADVPVAVVPVAEVPVAEVPRRGISSFFRRQRDVAPEQDDAPFLAEVDDEAFGWTDAPAPVAPPQTFWQPGAATDGEPEPAVAEQPAPQPAAEFDPLTAPRTSFAEFVAPEIYAAAPPPAAPATPVAPGAFVPAAHEDVPVAYQPATLPRAMDVLPGRAAKKGAFSLPRRQPRTPEPPAPLYNRPVTLPPAPSLEERLPEAAVYEPVAFEPSAISLSTAPRHERATAPHPAEPPVMAEPQPVPAAAPEGRYSDDLAFRALAELSQLSASTYTPAYAPAGGMARRTPQQPAPEPVAADTAAAPASGGRDADQVRGLLSGFRAGVERGRSEHGADSNGWKEGQQ